MRKFLLLCILLIISTLNLYSQTTISTDTVFTQTWTKLNSPYKIDTSITIPDGETLTIEPGVIVEFQGHHKLNVQGRLVAVGTMQDTITFTINDTTGFCNADTALGGWGGIRFINTPTLNDTSKIEFCKIEFGKAIGDEYMNSYGGGICVKDFNKLKISKNLFYFNYSKVRGGGIYLENVDSIKIESNTFYFNKSDRGGGIFLASCTNFFIINNKIFNNISINHGGGALVTGTTNQDFNSYINGNLICNNSSIKNVGGGIYFSGNVINFINNTIYNNAAGPYYGGGGLIGYNSKVKFINNLIWSNHISISNSEYEFKYCNIQELYYEDFEKNHNISIAPYLAKITEGEGSGYDALDANWSLTDSSVCINSALNDTAGLGLLPNDLLNNYRVFDGNIDIGAIEYQEHINNRSPVLKPKKDIIISKMGNQGIKDKYYDFDSDDSHTVTITTENSNLIIENIFLDNGLISFDVQVLNNYLGSVEVEIELTDNSGEDNNTATDNFFIEVVDGTVLIVDENIKKDTIWSTDYVLVENTIEVVNTSKLTILPGTKVLFNGFYQLDILGELIAVGTDTDSILFSVRDNNGFIDYRSENGGWMGLSFNNYEATTKSSILKYCIIENVKNIDYGWNNSVIDTYHYQKLTIQNCVIRNNFIYVTNLVDIWSSISFIMEQNKFYNNVSYYANSGGISLQGGFAVLRNNTILNTSGEGLILASDSSLVTGNLITNDLQSIIFKSGTHKLYNNTIVSKYSQLIEFENSSSALVVNSILGNNEYGSIEGNVNTSAKFINCVISSGESSIKFSNYILENLIEGNPRFVNSNENNFTLTGGSPSVNNGTSDTTGLGLKSYDLNGSPRIYQGDVSIIDIGAYELQREPNQVPTDIELSNNTVQENVYSGSFVGSFSTTDIDDTEHDYILLNEDGCRDGYWAFKINGENLVTYNQMDYETDSIYDICVQTDDGDGGIYAEKFTINVIKKDESTGIADSFQNIVKVYPNPTSENISFSFNEGYQELNFELINLEGKVIFNKAITNNSNINIEGFPKGLYFYRLCDNQKMIQSNKIIFK